MPARRQTAPSLHRSVLGLFGLSSLMSVVIAPAAFAGDPRCAIYGPDFVAVEGSSTCVRLGGHIRAEAGTHLTPSLNNGWGNGMRSAGVRSDSSDAIRPPGDTLMDHLRVHEAITDPFSH